MANPKRQIKLFAHLLNTGNQMGGWRHPQAHAGGLHDIRYFLRMAQRAEAAKFDAVFFADGPGFRRVEGRDAFSRMDVGKLEPITMLAALAMGTERIGLIATASTSFNEPYNIARKFASLDHISGGRAGWNAVTSTGENEAHNFGFRTLEGHETRYERASEFIDVVRGLWDSWEDDAFLLDKQSGRYFNPDKLHALGHDGKYYFVHGPLNVGRAPQGHPLLVQAGGSETGRALGARTADAIFTVNPPLDEAKAFYADMKRRVAAFGRDPESLKIMPSIQVVIGETRKDAEEKAAYLDGLIHPDLAPRGSRCRWAGSTSLAIRSTGRCPTSPKPRAIRCVRASSTAPVASTSPSARSPPTSPRPGSASGLSARLLRLPTSYSGSSKREPPTAPSCHRRISQARWTISSTRYCRSCGSVACSALSTRARRCARTSACCGRRTSSSSIRSGTSSPKSGNLPPRLAGRRRCDVHARCGGLESGGQ